MDLCPLCGGRDVALLYRSNAPTRPEAQSEYRCTSSALGIHPDIVRCRACTFTFNAPSSGAVDHLAEYARVDDPEYLEQRRARRLTYGRELDRIEALRDAGDLLDVGCYTGFFLEQARERGWRVRGVEPSKWAAEHAQTVLGLDVFHGPVEQFAASAGAGTFDVVTLWDVLEHLEDPVAVLRSIRGLLRPDGLLAFTTHNLDRPLARLLRGRYPFFMEMHTVHLNDRTLALLLETAGFVLVAKHVHRRALRLEYLLSRLRRLGETPARAAERLARALGLADRVVWIGFVGLETILARPRGPRA
jgi:2-polyprenyl-3-methyl-5-hydroxy-6-metoxy-1,4-benzoquinol methylase